VVTQQNILLFKEHGSIQMTQVLMLIKRERPAKRWKKIMKPHYHLAKEIMLRLCIVQSQGSIELLRVTLQITKILSSRKNE
jgi:hypothetical protein